MTKNYLANYYYAKKLHTIVFKFKFIVLFSFFVLLLLVTKEALLSYSASKCNSIYQLHPKFDWRHQLLHLIIEKLFYDILLQQLV